MTAVEAVAHQQLVRMERAAAQEKAATAVPD
jgi:hypothetical protein